MSRRLLVRLFVALFLLLAAWSAHVEGQRPPGALTIQPVSDGLYMISGEGGNVAVYVTDEGVILVDSMFHRNHADILGQVRSVTDQPIRYVVNTHQHDDHAGGDHEMLRIADVIAHANVRANLVAKRQPFYEDTPGTPIGLPRITFSDATSIHLGGREVQARYFGRGHTNGDAIIYFPDVRVIHTGDLFLARRQIAGATAGQSRPRGVNIFVDYAQGGSFLEWSATLEGALTLDFDSIIPGHGPVSTREHLVSFKADLEIMRNRLAGLIQGGASKDEIVTTLEADYGWRATGCPPTPPTPGCLQFQQVDALIAELKR
jgi:cyclase